MTRLLAIDPGTHATGWALFSDRTLTMCGLIRGGTLGDLHVNAASVRGLLYGRVHKVVMELPVDRGRNAKSNPRTLIKLAIAGGIVLGALADQSEIELVAPATWKGSVPKNLHGARVLKSLYREETHRYNSDVANVPPSLRHNVLDSLGIALYAVGRDANRRRVE